MNESFLLGCLASLMQFAVAGYALRLNRHFGTARVGWSLFGAFALLALLQLVQSTDHSDAGAAAALRVNVTYILISFMLLIGMLHMESMLKQRMRAEKVEQQLRAALESEVKSKTAHLNRAIVELVREVDESKRMAAIIESADVNRNHSEPIMMPFPSLSNDEAQQFLTRVLGGEWIAHF
jgi:hypothetical protein